VNNVTSEEVVLLLQDFSLDDSPYDDRKYTQLTSEEVQSFINDAEVYVSSRIRYWVKTLEECDKRHDIMTAIKYYAAGEIYLKKLGDNRQRTDSSSNRGSELVGRCNAIIQSMARKVYTSFYDW
jgi:hypothetical protein